MCKLLSSPRLRSVPVEDARLLVLLLPPPLLLLLLLLLLMLPLCQPFSTFQSRSARCYGGTGSTPSLRRSRLRCGRNSGAGGGPDELQDLQQFSVEREKQRESE